LEVDVGELIIGILDAVLQAVAVLFPIHVDNDNKESK
jgi:hypothetical protein